MPEEKTKTTEETGKEEKKDNTAMIKKGVFFGIIVLVLIVEAIIAYVLVQATRQEDPRMLEKEKTKQDDATARIKQTSMGMTTDPIEVIVNISSKEDGERYAKVAIQLEYDDIKYPELGEMLTARIPRIKNILIDKVSSMRLENLLSAKGKMLFRNIIRREINKTIPSKSGEVRMVLLSEFIIQ